MAGNWTALPAAAIELERFPDPIIFISADKTSKFLRGRI